MLQRLKQRLLTIAGLILLIFAAHAPAWQAGFVWDDTALVLRDPLIRSCRLIPEGLEHFLFTDATASNFYRPLQRLTYTAEYAAFAFRAAPYHLDNVCLHAAAAVALFLFALAFLELFGVANGTALVVGAIASAAWALHPMHSAVVDYVSGRADSLAALFGFSGLYFAIRALLQKGAGAWKLHALAALTLLASALSKESGLLFAAIWLLLIVLQGQWRHLFPAVVGIAFAITIYATLRSQAGTANVPQLTPPAPAAVRPIIAARALAEYAGLLVLPINLHMDRDVETHPWGLSDASLSVSAWRELETLAGVALFCGFLFWTIRAHSRAPAVFKLLIFATVAYLPVCGLFALNATIAEHWIYMPSAFLLLAGALQVSHRLSRSNNVVLAVAVVWVGFLGARTFFRARDWHDERTFYEHTISSGADSARMLINLGVLEMNQNRLAEARTFLQQALAKEPEQPFALLNLAAVALKQSDFAAARDLLTRAQRNPVSRSRAYELMAVLEFKETGQLDLLRLRLASRTGTPSWTISRRYIRALAESGHIDAAVRELRVVLATEWYRAESWQLMSEFLAQLGQQRAAGEARAEAQRFDVHLEISRPPRR